MKQTTVEWLFDNLNILKSTRNIEVFEKAKQMEKEQMCGFAEFIATYPVKNRNINGEMLHAESKYDGAERTLDLLETFKSE